MGATNEYAYRLALDRHIEANFDYGAQRENDEAKSFCLFSFDFTLISTVFCFISRGC